MSNAAATLVGQNLGANKPERAVESTWTAAKVNMAFLGMVGVCFYIFAEPLVQIFTDDFVVLEVGVTCLTIISYGYLCYALGMVMVQAFNGAGDTKTPTLINLFCFWLIQIPLAYFLSIVLDWKLEGILYAVVFSETMLAIIGVIFFQKGKWKLKMV